MIETYYFINILLILDLQICATDLGVLDVRFGTFLADSGFRQTSVKSTCVQVIWAPRDAKTKTARKVFNFDIAGSFKRHVELENVSAPIRRNLV